MNEPDLASVRVPAAAATLVAFYFAAQFQRYLPITDGWTRIETVLFPLSSLDVAFHEAGHLILGFFGSEFLMVAGGTLMQLAMPSACLAHFIVHESPAGMGFCLFWIGLNLAEISLYAADAQAQALILITGMSGREGGGHDWAFMLGRLGLTKHCVGAGEIFFFAGVWLMVFAAGWLLLQARQSLRSSVRQNL